jgi:hypothetical protein
MKVLACIQADICDGRKKPLEYGKIYILNSRAVFSFCKISRFCWTWSAETKFRGLHSHAGEQGGVDWTPYLFQDYPRSQGILAGFSPGTSLNQKFWSLFILAFHWPLLFSDQSNHFSSSGCSWAYGNEGRDMLRSTGNKDASGTVLIIIGVL